MKWLMILLLISCGHETPPAKNLSDVDGDQIIGENEVQDGVAEYVAEPEMLGEIKGMLSFKANFKLVEIPFTNSHDLHADTLMMLTKSLKALKKEDYFSEWSRLRHAKLPEFVTDKAHYEINFTFERQTNIDASIYLNSGKAERKISQWGHHLSVSLSKAEIDGLIKGEAYFFLKSNSRPQLYDHATESIKRKTYRVYFNDGENSKIFYVSKKLPFEELIKKWNLPEPQALGTPGSVLAQGIALSWWSRDLGEYDKVLAFTSPSKISAAYKEGFTHTKMTLQRNNGTLVNSLKINKSKDARIILKIYAAKSQRTFAEAVTQQKRSSGGGKEGNNDSYYCYWHSRTVQSEVTSPVALEEIWENLILKNEKGLTDTTTLDLTFIEGSDERGQFTEMIMNYPGEYLEIGLVPTDAASYVTTGTYHSYCAHYRDKAKGIATAQTNYEGHFTLELDTYVEKMN